jgi:hypothetical protein
LGKVLITPEGLAPVDLLKPQKVVLRQTPSSDILMRQCC